MATIFTQKRDDRGSLYALVLTDGSSEVREEHLNGDFIQAIGTFKNRVQRIYGEDAEFVPSSKLQQELESRRTHSPEIIAMLEKQSELFGIDTTGYIVYGSAMRPMSTTWVRIPDCMCIPANKQQTGYHSYVIVPESLGREIIERYELEFVSRPAIEQ
ncbi:MAG: hypothetical protein PVS3B3_31230 [Ktedonobacteraceae bacterium]